MRHRFGGDRFCKSQALDQGNPVSRDEVLAHQPGVDQDGEDRGGDLIGVLFLIFLMWALGLVAGVTFCEPIHAWIKGF